jgi:hypothetical protein
VAAAVVSIVCAATGVSAQSGDPRAVAAYRLTSPPGSDLFVVYNEGRETGVAGQTAWLQNRTFVVKLTRLFRY